jgi:hypothetical protein
MASCATAGGTSVQAARKKKKMRNWEDRNKWHTQLLVGVVKASRLQFDELIAKGVMPQAEKVLAGKWIW